MASKYTDKQLRNIADGLEDALLEEWGNVTAAAKRLGLTRGQLMGLVSNHSRIASAYKAAWEMLVDKCQAAWFRAGSGSEKGINTQATGRILQAQRPDDWNPVQRVEDVTGYAKPGAKREAGEDDDGGTAAPRLTLVANGGAPPGKDGTRDE